MTSQAERLRRKRKRATSRVKADNANEPRGLTFEEAADKLAIEARSRVYGLPKDKASNPMAGTGIGRAYLQGQISIAQHDALDKAQRLYAEHRRAISAHDPLAKRSAGGCGDKEPQSYEEWANRICREYKTMKRAVRDAQYESRAANLFAAFEYAVTRDEMHDAMLGDNRILANLLVRFFKIPVDASPNGD